jgi:hypothetical protein
VRKTLAYESYRAARREHMLAHQRARQGFALRYPFSEESGASRYVFSYSSIHANVPYTGSLKTIRARHFIQCIQSRDRAAFWLWSIGNNFVFCHSEQYFRLRILTHYRTSASISMQRAQDEYELAMTRNVDSWGYSPPSRSTGDSPESRRRQARGRIGNSRAAHLLGRPTSVGSASARWINPASTHGNPPQRGTNVPPVNNAPRRSVTPGLPRQNSGGSSSSSSQTPPRNRALSGLSSSPPAEEASPPVAVGSGLSRERQVERQGEPTLRRSLDFFAGPSSTDWNSDPLNFMYPDQFNLGQSSRPRPHSNDLGNSTFQTLLDATHPLGQNPPSGAGSDANRHQQGEPNRNSDMDGQMLGNPQPRWSR